MATHPILTSKVFRLEISSCTLAELFFISKVCLQCQTGIADWGLAGLDIVETQELFSSAFDLLGICIWLEPSSFHNLAGSRIYPLASDTFRIRKEDPTTVFSARV